LSASPFGETPVSKSSVWLRSPRLVVTSAAKPCSASRHRLALHELGRRNARRAPHRRPSGGPHVGHQPVVAVVHQRRDHHLVDWFEGDGIDGITLDRPRRRRGDVVSVAVFVVV
jgi:hypothetical protein